MRFFRLSHFRYVHVFYTFWLKKIIAVALTLLMLIAFAHAESIHTLENNETIYQISQKYNIPLEILLTSNSIRDPSHLPIGKKIRIPETGKLSEENAKTIVEHIVVKGDTLYAIAKQYNTDIQSLEKLNEFSNADIIRPGTVLRVERRVSAFHQAKPETPVHVSEENAKLTNYMQDIGATETYVVVKGDTLYSIAEKYQISIEYLENLNGVSRNNVIKPGRILIVSAHENINGNVTGTSLVTSSAVSATEGNAFPVYDKLVISAPSVVSSSVNTSKQSLPVSTALSSPAIAAKKIDVPATASSTVQGKFISANSMAELPPGASSLLLDRARPFGVVSKQFPVKGTSYKLKTHSGVFIESDANSVVKAVESGIVLYIVPSHGTFRNILVIQSKSGEIFVYGCQQDIAVKQGELVAKGQVLGKVGIMPLAQKPVLYFAVFKKDKFIDPKKFLL